MTKTKFAVSCLEQAGDYYCGVENTSEILNKSVEWSISGAVKIAFVPASQTVEGEALSSWRRFLPAAPESSGHIEMLHPMLAKTPERPLGELDQRPAPFETVASRPPQGEDFPLCHQQQTSC
jgi:hypothetical protein